MKLTIHCMRDAEPTTIEAEPNETVEAVARRAARTWYDRVPNDPTQYDDLFGLQGLQSHRALNLWRTIAEEGIADGSEWELYVTGRRV